MRSAKRAALLAVPALLTLLASTSAHAQTRFFSDTDPMNLGVSPNKPTKYSNSDTLAATFGSKRYNATVATGSQGVPIYRAKSSTPAYSLKPRAHVGDWGPNPFAGYKVPWDASWKLPHSADNWVVVISADGKHGFECWKAQTTGSPKRLSCEWGAVSTTTGASNKTTGAPTGSGISRLAGVITQSDWNNGINHALTYATPDNGSGHVYPAKKTDGSGSGAMREGDYIWMDASCHPKGLDTAQRRVFDALQKYGAFNVDNGDSFGFASQMNAKVPGSHSGDWLGLSKLPWKSCLHVGKVSKRAATAAASGGGMARDLR